MEAGNPGPQENPGKDLKAGFILGSDGFVNWIKEEFISDREDDREIPQIRRLKPAVETGTAVEEVC